jgi:hypothetical protein
VRVDKQLASGLAWRCEPRPDSRGFPRSLPAHSTGGRCREVDRRQRGVGNIARSVFPRYRRVGHCVAMFTCVRRETDRPQCTLALCYWTVAFM